MASTAKFDEWQSTAGVKRQNVIQVNEYRSTPGPKAVSGGVNIEIMSVDIVVKPNSRLYVIYHSGQIMRSSFQCNPQFYFTIDGVYSGEWDTNHYYYVDSGNSNVFRMVTTLPWISNPLSAGAHTLKVYGNAYNGTVTYDYQSEPQPVGYPNRRSRMTVMEIAG